MGCYEYRYGSEADGQHPAGPALCSKPGWVLQLRAAFAHGFLDDEKAAALRMWLVALDWAGDEPVVLHLSTEDAGLRAAFAVADTMEAMRSPVNVHLAGQVGGPALALLAAAQRRTMARHATIRLSEPQEKFDGTASELALREFEHRWLADALYAGLAAVTGRPAAEIRNDAERDRLFNLTQAVAYGFVEETHGLPAGNLGAQKTGS